MKVQGSMVRRVNSWVTRLRDSKFMGKYLRGRITVLTYTGRRSGRTFSTPVSFRRNGDTVDIVVVWPDAKTWWRNFEGEGGALTLELDGTQQTGHATSHRDDKGRVTVRVQL